MQKIRIGTRGCESCTQGRFEHIARAARILADDDPCFFIFAVIPAEVTAYLKRMHDGQINVCLSSESVSAKVLTHILLLSLFDFFGCCIIQQKRHIHMHLKHCRRDIC